MTKSHNPEFPAAPKPSDRQASEEIERIKTILLQTKFKTLGWFPDVITPKENQPSVPVPKTAFEAYSSLINNEQTNPIKALAMYYAHFIVAIRPEHDHSSRQEETRQFYQTTAARKGTDIFPDDPSSAELFDTLLQTEVDALILKRSPEQKSYLDFQAKVKTEISHIQSMTDHLQALEQSALSENKLDVVEELKFLGEVIHRMKTAETREDVNFYAKDVLLILSSISDRIDNKNQITALQDSMRIFQEHHLELMTDLSDKKNALYLSSALHATTVAVANPLAHALPFYSHEVLSHMPTHVGIVENPVGSAVKSKLKEMADQKKISAAEEENEPLTHNIYEVDNKASSFSDKYANFKAAVEQPEVQKKAAKAVGLTVAVIVFPWLAIPAAVTSAVYAAGGIAFNLYTKQNQLNEVEKVAKLQREQHEIQMKKYRENPTKTYLTQAGAGFWNKTNPPEQDSKAPASNPKNDPEKKLKNS